MKSRIGSVCVLGFAWMAISGCVPTIPTGPTTVALVNETSQDVRPNLFVSSSATNEATLFLSANLVTDFTTRPFPELRGNETVTLTYECDELQSLGVYESVMFDAATLTVDESDEQIFRLQGTDFECGATLRFVFYTEGGEFGVRLETQ